MRSPPLPIMLSKQSLADLFEDIELEMSSIYETDSVLVGLHDKVVHYQMQADAQAADAVAIEGELSPIDVKMATLKAELKELDRERRSVLGRINSCKLNELAMQRMARRVESNIEKRRNLLLMSEARKRLNLIGRDIRHNKGRRKGGGVTIVDKDAPKEPVDPEILAKVQVKQEDLFGNSGNPATADTTT